MRVVRFHDPKEFSARVRPALIARECENCALIGTIDRLAEGQPSPRDTLRVMFAFEADGSIQGVAVQTWRVAMMVSRLPGDGIDDLLEQWRSIDGTGGGFVGPSESTDLLADRWSALTGRSKRLHLGLKLFQLDQVDPIPPVTGRMVCAATEHLDVLADFSEQFSIAVGEPDGDPRGHVTGLIEERRLFAWVDDGRLTSMAAVAGPTPNGIRINHVYTPPALRGRGYASNLVAALSRQMLDSGKRFCFLFTDLANPTSNKIYQQIGYRPVCDFRHWRFDS